MGNVYVLTSGEYSDYAILGVFSTREAAEASLAELEKTQDDWCAAVEKFPLDELPWKTRQRHTFYMDRAGDTDMHSSTPTCSAAPETEIIGPRCYGSLQHLYCRISGRTMEQAIKIANERRVQMIASGEWPEED